MSTVAGQIIRSHGRSFVVESDGHEYQCSTRGKRVDFTCGDRVDILVQNNEQAVIENRHERSSLLYRQDEWRTKMIAANVTRMVIVSAAVPTPSEEFLCRCLLAAEAADIDPLIVVNKADLPQSDAWFQALEPYRAMGYPVLTLSAKQDVSALLPWLEGQTSVMIGQSGMGKSTLTNALLPHAGARTAEISTALDTGRHTTTHATLYHLDANSQLIDSPGLQEFGLKHLDPTQLIYYFPEMRPLIGQCRFHNCSHRAEPGCALKEAVASGSIRPYRLELLQRLISSLS
jgi:ribosome biogenesis GTPase